jgi:hypothetical protein
MKFGVGVAHSSRCWRADEVIEREKAKSVNGPFLP